MRKLNLAFSVAWIEFARCDKKYLIRSLCDRLRTFNPVGMLTKKGSARSASKAACSSGDR